MSIDFETANFILQSVYPTNSIMVDEQGVPSVMVKIPKVTLRDLGVADSDEVHPAFKVNGKVLDAIYVSKFPNTIINGVAASLPAVEPTGNVSYKEACEACKIKGKGWHMITRTEFAMLAELCARLGFEPRGNNNFGKDYHEQISTAIKCDEKGIHTEAGTGPASWFHNNSYSGIADLNGNNNEWVGSLRLVYGELQVIPDNDGADNTVSQYADGDKWMCIDGTTGEYIKPQGDGHTPNAIKLDFYGRDTISNDPTLFSGWQWITGEITNSLNKRRGLQFVATVCEATICDAAKQKLEELALMPDLTKLDQYGMCRLFANNGGPDQRAFCGGRNLDKGDSGVFFCRIGDGIDYKTPGTGVRAVYVDLD